MVGVAVSSAARYTSSDVEPKPSFIAVPGV
jgi:hypothetical protein